MISGLVRITASAAGLAVVVWGIYYAFLVPATAHATLRYNTVQNCNMERTEWLKTDNSVYGDNHARAVGFARLAIVCADMPKVIEDNKKNVSPNVAEMAKQTDIQTEALGQLKKAYP